MERWIHGTPEYIKEFIDILGGLEKVVPCYREFTYEFVGFRLEEKDSPDIKPYLPADATKQNIVRLLNQYVIENKLILYGYEQDIPLLRPVRSEHNIPWLKKLADPPS